jgi:choline dehydrogenase
VDSSTEYDVLIVGGGTAGCVLAARLSESGGRSVCLLEGGPDYGPQNSGAWPSELLDGREGPDTHDWRDADRTMPVARVIGGCSAHNLCFWIHPAAADWDAWAAASGDGGWSAESMRTYIARAESAMPLRHFRGEEINPWLTTCIAAADEVGLGALKDVNDHRYATGLGPMPLNAVGTTRWNAAFAYLDLARGRPNLDVIADAMVERLELGRERAAGVRVRRNGSRSVIRARRVIVCAGTYGSPALLLRSGVGPEAELARHAIKAAAVLPVGERLRDHFSVALRLAPTASMQKRIDEHAASGLTFFSQGIGRACSSQARDGLWDLHLMVGLVPAEKGGFPERSGHVLGLNAALVSPDWTGSVTLYSTDPADLPLVTPQDLGCERDASAIADGVALCGDLIVATAARGAWQERLTPEQGLSGGGLREHCARSLRPYFHPVGTCAMGPADDGVSVVDASGRVHAFENLYVADASVMPVIPRANTNLPVLAAAERIADLLSEGG